LDFYWFNILEIFLEVREKCKTYLYFLFKKNNYYRI